MPEIKQRFVLELKKRFSCLPETELDETGTEALRRNGRTSRKPTAKQQSQFLVTEKGRVRPG